MSDQEVLHTVFRYRWEYYVDTWKKCKCGQKSIVTVVMGKTFHTSKYIRLCNPCYLAIINSIPLSSRCIYLYGNYADYIREDFSRDDVRDELLSEYKLQKL